MSQRFPAVVVGVTMFISMASMPAQADDHGCTVLLCLSNPAGPMAVADCVSPIKKLYRDLLRGRAFPTCDLIGGQAGTYATPATSAYEPCPAGTQPAMQGEVVAEGVLSADDGGTLMVGAADTSQPRQCDGDGACNDNSGPRACVGNFLGTGDTAALYGTVVWQQPSGGRAIDVFLDNAFTRRVQW
jgi:hypothetical protein